MKLSHLSIVVLTIGVVVAGCSKKSQMNNRQGAMDSSMAADTTSMFGANQGQANANNSTYTADLSGNNVSPSAVNTDASGEAYFRVNKDSTEIYYTVDLSNADSVKMVHIHYGAPHQNGPIVVWLFPKNPTPTLKAGPINGTLEQGVIADSSLVGPFEGKSVSDLIHAIQRDSAYVQVHTARHPAGALRGALEVQ